VKLNSNKQLNSILTFRFPERTMTSRQRTAVQKAEITWTIRRVSIFVLVNKLSHYLTTSHLHLLGNSKQTWSLKIRIKQCQRLNLFRAFTNTSVLFLQKIVIWVVKASNVDLEEEQRSKKIQLQDNSWKRLQEEATLKPRECNMTQRVAFEQPKCKRFRSNWKTLRCQLNQVGIIHRLWNLLLPS